MGKAKKLRKKIRDNQEGQIPPEVKQRREELEARIRRCMEEEQYADVLEALAERVQLRDTQPEFMYDGAYAYFMLGDYERAAAWVDNVLRYDQQNLAARILLARICILEDRVDEGLAVFEFVLGRGKSILSDEEKEEIEDIVSYYVRRDGDKVRREYPNIAAFVEERKGMTEPLGEGIPVKSEKEAPSVKTPPGSSGSAKEILQALKDKVLGGQAAVKPAAAEKSQEPAGEAPGETGSSPREILQALRDKVLHQGAGEKQEARASAAQVQSGPKDERREAAPPREQVPTEEAEQKKQAVLQQDISLREKVRLLNAFAGGYYYQRNLAGAKSLLTEALHIDSSDMTTLTNLAWVLLESGEKEKAVQLVTQAQVTDFGLIRILRDA